MANIDELAAQAAASVSEDEVVKTASDLVRIPSHIGEETGHKQVRRRLVQG